MNKLKRFIKTLKNETYHTIEEEKAFHNSIIDGVIEAKNVIDLHVLILKVQNYDFNDTKRYTFLIGLLEGALLQFNKEKAIEELNTFKHI